MAEPCPPYDDIRPLIDIWNNMRHEVLTAIFDNKTAKIVSLRTKTMQESSMDFTLLVEIADATNVVAIANKRYLAAAANDLLHLYRAHGATIQRVSECVVGGSFGGRNFSFVHRSRLCVPQPEAFAVWRPLPTAKNVEAIRDLFETAGVVVIGAIDLLEMQLFDEVDAAQCRFLVLDDRCDMALDASKADQGTLVENGYYEARWYSKCPRSMHRVLQLR